MRHALTPLPAAVALSFMSLLGGSAPAQSARELWKAEFGDSLGQSTALLTLTRTSDGSLEGQYIVDSLRQGKAVIKVAGQTYSVFLAQTAACAGSFSGELSFDGVRFSGSYAGFDCRGWHGNGVLTITRNIDPQPGNGAEPALGPSGVVSPTALNFGPVLVSQTSLPKRVSLTNTGDSELTVSSISISGHFALPTNHCAAGVKPGDTL